MKNRARRCLLGIIGTFVFPAVQQSRAGGDFLVVENIDHLQVYNKYQQEASAKDRQVLVPFVPMKILNANDVLGDGFSFCMQVEIDGQIFYLLKDKNSSLLRSELLGFCKTFSNTTALLDTVQILTGQTITFSPITSSVRTLQTGEKVFRVFGYQNTSYCRTLDTSPQFWWIDFRGKNNGKHWSILKRIAPINFSISSDVVHKTRARIEEVNRVLKSLFSFFNSQTRQNKPPPQWNIESSRKAILCTLQGTTGNEFEQSTFYLVNDLENILLGSEFEVIHTPTRIEIRQK